MVVERNRPAFVQCLQRDPVIAREDVRDGTAGGLFDVGLADIGIAIRATQDEANLVASISAPQQVGQSTRAFHGRQLRRLSPK